MFLDLAHGVKDQAKFFDGHVRRMHVRVLDAVFRIVDLVFWFLSFSRASASLRGPALAQLLFVALAAPIKNICSFTTAVFGRMTAF